MLFERLWQLIDGLITVGGSDPRAVARTTALLIISLYLAGKISKAVAQKGLKKCLMYVGFLVWKHAYQGSDGMKQQLEEARGQFKQEFEHKESIPPSKNYWSLPKKGVSAEEILSQMKEWSAFEKTLWGGKHRKCLSGSIYHGGEELQDLMNQAYGYFSLTNPLHPDIFPCIRKMESEVISMTISLFGGDPMKECGLVTSGGTESIVCAIRAYKRQALIEKGIRNPELIIPSTAHAAFEKACEMFEIKLIKVPVNQETFAVETSEMRKRINRNTIAIVGSAVSYAQGTMDPIHELSKLALEHNIGLHVDSCLGSFQIAILRKIKYPGVDPCTFECPGVTSISADTHKFGFSVKGTSVIMFRSRELRKYTYHCFADNAIGMYATPTLSGSKPGGLIAATWAAMVNIGYEGYLQSMLLLNESAKKIRKVINDNNEIELMGNPPMSVVAFRATKESGLDTFHISGALSARGYSLNNCQKPNCSHICVTLNNYQCADSFEKDLNDAIQDIQENPDKYAESGAAMYGVLVSIPSSSMKVDLLNVYLDVAADPMDYGNPVCIEDLEQEQQK